LFLTDRQNRARSVAQYFLGDAPFDEPRQSAPAMSDHHDQVGGQLDSELDDCHAFYDRVASLIGVRKRFDIKVEETRSIPLSVIDAITARWDPEARKAETKSAPVQTKRLSTTEVE